MNNLHLVHEVVNDSNHAEAIAIAKSSKSRYTHFANALLIGDPDIQPYHPVYLQGLPDNMSGMWVVLSVVHTINLKYHYTMSVRLGSNSELLAKKPPKDVKGSVDIHQITTKLLNEDNSFYKPTANVKRGEYVFKSNEFYPIPRDKVESLRSNYNPLKDYIDGAGITSQNYMETIHSTHTPDFAAKSYSHRWIREK